MKEQGSWERFLRSGKVEDYLRYAADKALSCDLEVSEELGIAKEQEPETYAGFADIDRNHIESGTHRGI